MAVVYRVIKYEGWEEWLKATLVRSIQGEYNTGAGVITATIVDRLAPWQEEALERVVGKQWVPQREVSGEGKDH